jgi:hypothetical protein
LMELLQKIINALISKGNKNIGNIVCVNYFKIK